MLNTRNALLEKICLGEDQFLELKEVKMVADRLRGPSQDVLSDEMAAFANSVGGVLLLGVEDATRLIVGIPIEQLDAVELVVNQACAQSVKPPLAPIIERMFLPDNTGVDRAVIRIEVPRSLFVHQSAGGYLHRVGSSKHPIAPDHLARLFQQRSQSRLIRFDETAVSNARMEDLEAALWKRFAPAQTQDSDEVLLSKLAMVATDSEGKNRPTIAGLLLGSRIAHQYLPGAFIQAVAYRGGDIQAGDSLYQLDARDITGPLDQQIADACAFVRKNMQMRAIKHLSGGREDRPQYDMLAVFEAITNAVAHRDYSMAGSKVRLRMFADRLELYSPGMLPNSMTPASLAYRQAARNEAITSLLARCSMDAIVQAAQIGMEQVYRARIMDKRGEGVSIIYLRSERLSGRKPEYRLADSSELILTIYAAPE
jgi:ATP-dependent DNA helicase RecG